MTQTERTRWTPEEKTAVESAYLMSSSADEFLTTVQRDLPGRPLRTFKAYLTYLNEFSPKESRNVSVYDGLCEKQRLYRLSVVKPSAAPGETTIGATPPLPGIGTAPSVSVRVAAPTVPATPAPGDVVEKDFYYEVDIAKALGVNRSKVNDAFGYGYLPLAADGSRKIPADLFGEVRVEAFTKPFFHACKDVLARRRAAKTLSSVPVPHTDPADLEVYFNTADASLVLGVSQRALDKAIAAKAFPYYKASNGLWMVTITDIRKFQAHASGSVYASLSEFEAAARAAFGIPDPTPEPAMNGKVIPTAFKNPADSTKGAAVEYDVVTETLSAPRWSSTLPGAVETATNEGGKLNPLDDPNPDAKETFTLAEAREALGLPQTFVGRDAMEPFFILIDKEYRISRSDLRKIRATMRDAGLSFDAACLRVAARIYVPAGEPRPYDAPVRVELASEFDDVNPELYGVLGETLSDDPGDCDSKYNSNRVATAREGAGKGPSASGAPVGADAERTWALEALLDGVLDYETVCGILNVKDPARTAWALKLLAEKKVTLAQAANLIR